MRKRIPRALLPLAPLAAAFALSCALLAPAAPPTVARRAPQESEASKKKQPADSTVYGRVVYDDTGRPVRRARVLLVDETGARPEYNTLTDADGAFRIERVRAGFYFAFVDIPGVLSPVSFLRNSEVRGRNVPDFTEARKFFDTIDVDGNQDSRLTVHARRGAALSGRVTYADGDPAVNVTINLMRRGPGGKLEKFLAGININALAGLKTDDRGSFRISGLPPDEYVIAVSEQVDHGEKGNEGGMRDPMASVLESLSGQQFLMTFYPSATSAKEAVVVKAEAGVERSGLDITIPERALHKVGGVVRGKNDKRPVAGATVTIFSREDGTGAASALGPDRYTEHNTTTADAEGLWEFREIPEGSYAINVKPPEEHETELSEDGEGPPEGNMNSGYSRTRTKKKRGYATARRDLEVIDSDLSGVAVELNDGARVSGTVAYENGKKEGYGYFRLRRVSDGTELTQDELSGSLNSYILDSRFEIAGLPAGKYFLQFSGFGDEGKAYVKSMTWNGRDITREPLELAEGASVEGILVTISTTPSKLRARASGGARNAAMRGVNVTLLPSDLTGWSPYTQQLSCSTDDGGACEIAAPPGEYRVVAIQTSAAAGAYEAELRRRAPAAPRVTLAARETRDFEVALPEK